MDNEKIEGFIKKIGKNKKVTILLGTVLVLILISLCLSYLNDVNNITRSEKKNSVNVTATDDSGSETQITDVEYEEKQEKDLGSILSKINGVGKVDVKLRFGGSEVKIPATDVNTQESKTEETDTEGGKRINDQTTGGEKIVMKNDDEGNSPFILETKKPKVTGVIVVAEGAENSKIKYEITKAVASLYDISLDDVNVFPRGEN